MKLITTIFTLSILSFQTVCIEIGAPTLSSILYKSKLDKKINGVVNISMNSQGDSGRITRDFYGTMVSNFTPFPKYQIVKELKLGKVRIGGIMYDRYNYKNSMFVGLGGTPSLAKDRSAKELIYDIKNVGATPIMQVNLLGLYPEVNSTKLKIVENPDPIRAYDMIKYYNGVLNLDIKDVCLGNEFAQWMYTHVDILGEREPFSADKYIDRFIKFSLAIKRAQDELTGKPESIKVWGPEISISYLDWQTGEMKKDCKSTDVWGVLKCGYGAEKQFEDFMPYFFYRLAKAEKDKSLNPKGYRLLDYASFHYYPNFRTDINDLDSIIEDENGMQDIPNILKHSQVMYSETFVNKKDISSLRGIKPNIVNRMKAWKNAYYPKAKLAITEFALDSFDGTFAYNPVIRPLYMADIIGSIAKSGISHFSKAFLNSFDGIQGSDPSLPWSLIHNSTDRTNLFYTYKLFSNSYIGKLLDTNDNLNDEVNSYAVYNDTATNKTINVLVINKSANSKSVAVNFVNNSKSSEVFQTELDPWSISLFMIPTRLNKKTKIVRKTVGAKEFRVRIDHYYQQVSTK